MARLADFIKSGDKGKILDRTFLPVEKEPVHTYSAQCTAETCISKDCIACPHFKYYERGGKRG